MKRNWALAFLVAGGFDIIDYIIPILSLPIIGDAVDIISIPIMYLLIGNYAFINTAELIPGADVIPTNLIATSIAYKQGD